MKKWNIELIEKTMLESVYNDKSKVKDMINSSIELYQKSKSDHPKIKSRLEILHKLKEKYQNE